MQLSPRRLFFGTSTALVLAALAASLVATRVTGSIGARRQAAQAATRLDETMRRDEATRSLSLAYLERARLGLGSPFRLMDQAARDPRLTDTVRHDVAWAIVDRVFDSRVYEIDPRALDAVSQPGAGAGHLAIIEDVIGGADDPRVAEAGVRVAYALAASSGVTGISSLPAVAEASALVRDRVLALEDLHRAISRARDDGVDLVTEIIHSRTTRELAVERPVLGSITPKERERAIAMAPGILERIESVTASASSPAPSSVLDRESAIALAKLAAREPPLAAIRVAVTSRGASLRADTTLDRSALAVIASAANEESLVAAYAYAGAGGRQDSPALHRLMVSAGAALRAHAQDPVWFAEQSANAGAVIGRFALKAISFDRDVPRAWRPFYTQMIGGALEDFTRAVPGYDPAGLSFRIEMDALPDSALALHDPRTHTIRLSAMTPSGTLAHELAHDVDWRAARRLFARSGGYATDRSMRESAIRLSASMRGLTTARIAGRGRISPHGSSRPAEVFARSVDWFVADVLASMGRTNGFLSAIQDPILAGFAAVPADAPSLGAEQALVGTLAEMTYVPDSTARAYAARWAELAVLDPAAVVIRTLEAPILSRRGPRPAFGISRQTTVDLATGSLCQLDRLRDGSAQDRLMYLAIEARARGIIARRARYPSSLLRTQTDARVILASVAEGLDRAGLIELAPAPFRPRCD
jgi:hypothetical protein